MSDVPDQSVPSNRAEAERLFEEALRRSIAIDHYADQARIATLEARLARVREIADEVMNAHPDHTIDSWQLDQLSRAWLVANGDEEEDDDE